MVCCIHETHLAIEEETFIVIQNSISISVLEPAFHGSWFVWFHEFLKEIDKKIKYTVKMK